MKKLIGFFGVIIISISALTAQDFDSLGIDKTICRLHLLPIGIGIEQRLYNNFTILADGGIGVGMEGGGYRHYVYFGIQPYVSIYPRVYLNLKSRYNRGKQVKDYSGFYGTFVTKYWFERTVFPDCFLVGPALGYQQSFFKHSYFYIHMGYGNLTIEAKDYPTMNMGFNLGFIVDDK